MRCRAIVTVLSFLFLAMASSSTAVAANPVPLLSSPLQPSAAIPGSGGFTLTVNGSNFVSGATVNWNGSARPTTFVNSSQLTATILAADVAAAGTFYVTVTNPPPSGVSNTLSFEVANPITNISFATPTNLSLGFNLTTTQPTVFTGDFNNDGKLDLLLAPLKTGAFEFSVLLGNGDGTFRPPVQYTVPIGVGGGSIGNVVVGDFNGDGKPDVLVTFVTNSGTPPFPTQYLMFFGNGDGTFTSNNTLNFISSIDHAVTGDFNKDGHLDIAGVCTTNGTQIPSVCILSGDGTGKFTQTDIVGTMGGPNTFDGLAVGDFNRDGNLDLAISDVNQNQVILFIELGKGDGTFNLGPQTIYQGSASVSSAGGGIAIADLNADGFPDLVMTEVDTISCTAGTCQTAFLTSFLGNGDGTFQPPRTGPAFTPSQGPNPPLLADLTPIIADLNGDGNPDIVTQNQILLLTNNTSSHLLVTAPLNILAVGDVNGDGKADLIGPGSDSTHLGEALQVPPTPDFYGVANPTYQNVTPGATAVYPITVTATDGFTGTVQFAVSGLPAGAIATFNPTTVSGSGNTVLSVSTSPSTPTGVYVLTLTGTSGTLSHSGFLQLGVAPAGTDLTDFSGSVSPSLPSAVNINTSMNPPPPATVQINVVPIRGFVGNVNFSVAGLPSGVTASFSPNPLVGGSGTVVLTLSGGKSVAAGTYPLTITATSGSHTHSAGVGLNVGPAGSIFGDFTGSVSPQSQTVAAGNSVNYSITISALYGFTNSILFSATNLPPSSTFNRGNGLSGGGGTGVISIQTSPATPAGTYTIGLQSNSFNVGGSLVHGTTVSLTVTAAVLVSIGVTPVNGTLGTGSTRPFTATATYTGGQTLDITNSVTWSSSNTAVATVSASGLVTGVATGQTTVTASSGAISGSATLTVVTPVNVITGTGSMAVPRQNATATLLNNGLVLLAGGAIQVGPGGPATNIAELYNPATGAFTPTGSLHFARSAHTATLLNNGKVLIAGGLDSSVRVVTIAELYDPATGTFSTTGALNVGREAHTATLLANGKVLLAGGDAGGFAFLAAAELYDPATGLFSLTAQLPARTRHAATLLNNGKALLVGGQDSSSNNLSSAMLYDPSTGTFTATGSMTDPRVFLTATLLNSGKVLALGGNSNPIGGNDSTTFEIYDPSTGTWGSRTSTAQQHAMHSATLLPSGLVFIAGGEAGYPNVTSATELIDPVALTANIGPSLSVPRENHTATLLNNGNVLIAGGQDTAGSNSTVNTADVYFPSSSNVVNLLSIRVSPVNSLAVVGSTTQFAAVGMYSDNSTQNITNSVVWASSNTSVATISATGLAAASATGQATITASQAGINGSTTLTVVNTPTPSIVLTANLTTPRVSHTTTLLNNGKVLIVGGNNHLGPNNSYQSLASAEVYDPVSGTFTATGSLQHARASHSAILLNNGKVLIVGGLDSTAGSNLVTVAEVYDPASGSFSPTGSLSAGRYNPAVSMLPSGKVLVLGGSGIGVNYVLPVEVYDPATGTFQTAATLPFQRSSFGTARLNNGKLLIAGGFDNTTNADSTSASLYDLVNGGFISTGSMQVAREGKATLLNSGKALVFGGFLLNGAGPGSFEIYDPTTQAFGSLTSVPVGRYAETDTLLPNGDVFLVGGDDNSNSFPKSLAASLLIDPVGLTSAAGPSLNVTRGGHTATLLNNGQVLIAGGSLNGDSSAELYTTSSLNLPNLTSIAVTPAAASLATGAAQRFIATGTFSNGSTQQLAAVVWSSSDATIAQISNDSTNPGVAVGIAPGTITITATVGSVSGSTTLTVP